MKARSKPGTHTPFSKTDKKRHKERRNFLKMGAMAGVVALLGLNIKKIFGDSGMPGMPGMDMGGGKQKKTSTLLTQDGKLVKVDSNSIKKESFEMSKSSFVRKGIPGRKFAMVIDLAACDGCKKCTVACQAMHHVPSDREWIKVYSMKDGEASAPYFFPRPCFHCDNPPCTKVCPVNATFKRSDGIVLIDNRRCIGCRFCMAACPYSARFFNWSRPRPLTSDLDIPYSPERGFPARMGTVEKCDFCPDMARKGMIPDCAAHCPMGSIYYGDQNEDAVTNSKGETLKLSQLLLDRAGYRYMEELGTEPRVYYLPPKNRQYPPPDTSSVPKRY